MITFFIITSFILNAIAFLAIILLFMRQNRLVELRKDQEMMIRDMEEAMSSYMLELKEENEQFIKRLNQIHHKEASVQDEERSQEHDKKEKGLPNLNPKQAEDKTQSISVGNLQRMRAVKGYQQTLQQDSKLVETEEEKIPETPIKEKSFLEEVLFLQKQGLSIAEIAKKLDKGQTEIELLLKFQTNRQ
ncbi:Sec-independent protein translocase protein TatA [Oikeobacillus pervagus]|uniref:Sec-independent protein translocase protein TatA n=1 Tax=Oikeobacillus pervagus TaxID=1325931 RepID=A0AAJ1SX83_9BACI|nr:hypothetical protein [Oikeobacillus pervagus]MDQ0214274.1 Sec-independent protein translocase protein TatA [Oikeobacillus pervagus]